MERASLNNLQTDLMSYGIKATTKELDIFCYWIKHISHTKLQIN